MAILSLAVFFSVDHQMSRKNEIKKKGAPVELDARRRRSLADRTPPDLAASLPAVLSPSLSPRGRGGRRESDCRKPRGLAAGPAATRADQPTRTPDGSPQVHVKCARVAGSLCALRAEAREREPPAAWVSARGVSRHRPSLSSLMILPQVHLRKPCYDFYFL